MEISYQLDKYYSALRKSLQNKNCNATRFKSLVCVNIILILILNKLSLQYPIVHHLYLYSSGKLSLNRWTDWAQICKDNCYQNRQTDWGKFSGHIPHDS